MPEIRYLCTMIGEVPVVTAPAEIDITNADQLRAVLLDGAKPDALSSLETNVIVTEILDAARRSASSGRTVVLPKAP